MILLIIFLLEITAFVQIGGALGVFNTFLIILLTAIFGLGRLKYYAAHIAQNSTQDKQQMADNLFHSMGGMLAGVLLLIPGFVTDSLGLLLLLPIVRVFLRTFILDSFISRRTFGFVDSHDLNNMKDHYKKKTASTSPKSAIKKGSVIDAEFEVIDKDEDNR